MHQSGYEFNEEVGITRMANDADRLKANMALLHNPLVGCDDLQESILFNG
jgi:hypothetical protein